MRPQSPASLGRAVALLLAALMLVPAAVVAEEAHSTAAPGPTASADVSAGTVSAASLQTIAKKKHKKKHRKNNPGGPIVYGVS